MNAIQQQTYIVKDYDLINLDANDPVPEGAMILHDICQFVRPIMINREQIATPAFLVLVNDDPEIPGKVYWRANDDDEPVLTVTLAGKRLNKDELNEIESKVRKLGMKTFFGGLGDQRKEVP